MADGGRGDVADLAAVARRFCLQNAIQHEGTCQAKALMGRVMGAHPEFRADAKAVMAALIAAGDEVNAMSLDEQKAALAADAPELLETKKKERRTGLKPLPGADDVDKVVLRFAPNPNGPLSLGHGRGVAIMAQYAKDYDADIILRYDDTDPQVKPPLYNDEIDGYAWILEDFTWLAGQAPARTVKASDRIEVYHDHAMQLIDKGGAYVCDCEPEEWRENKNQGISCPHRDDPAEAHKAAFQAMIDGERDAGTVVLRVKTDIQHKDPALRDWTAFRVVAKTAIHPRAKRGEIPDHRCWPLLDFESAVEDHLQGVTHIIRGKDLMDSTRKQQFLYIHMGWDYPQTLYWGRVSVHEFGKFSTSWMRKHIDAGDFNGWDDIRLPTLRALRRRGYSADAVRQFWVALGVTEKDIAISMQNIEAEDGKAIDDVTPRYFFVPNPRAISVSGMEGRTATPLLHPPHEDKGRRSLPAAGTVYVPGDEDSKQLRLKDLGNILLAGGTAFFTGEEIDRGMPIVQWLPHGQAEPFTVLKPGILADDAPEGAFPGIELIEGRVEPAALERIGGVVQFERFGFVRIESKQQGVWLHS